MRIWGDRVKRVVCSWLMCRVIDPRCDASRDEKEMEIRKEREREREREREMDNGHAGGC